MTKLEKVSVKSRINHMKTQQIFHEQLLKQEKYKTSVLGKRTEWWLLISQGRFDT